MTANYKLSRLQGKIIAIDGPAGSGKSTTARLLAERLGYIYLDTGAMYRALTWLALKHDVLVDDARALAALAGRANIEFKMDGKANRVFINGQDVTEAIRTPEVNKAVSLVSVHAGVREAMVARQREIARKGSVVADGRDTTSVVFPNAHIKIYLDASIKERARRRLLELTRQGVSTNINEQIEEISRRDEIDSGRDNSPLKRTADAIIVDTTSLTIEEQVDRIARLVKANILKV
jgi:cytidylate kinase